MIANNDSLSTEWNQAQAYQMRLDRCCQVLNEAKAAKDYQGWSEALWAFYLELSPVLYDTARGEAAASEQKRAERFLGVAERSLLASNVSPTVLFKRFVVAEKYLRKIMHTRGLLLPTRADPGSALLDDQTY